MKLQLRFHLILCQHGIGDFPALDLTCGSLRDRTLNPYLTPHQSFVNITSGIERDILVWAP